MVALVGLLIFEAPQFKSQFFFVYSFLKHYFENLERQWANIHFHLKTIYFLYCYFSQL